MKHKLSLRAVLAAGLATTVLAGCSNGGGASGGASPADAAEGEVTTITFMSWLRNSEAVVDAFNASHTDVQVEFQTTPSAADNYTTLSNAAKAGTAPDVATVEYPYLADLVTQGLLAPLSEDATAVVEERYPDAAKNLVQMGGETWSFPLDLAVWLMYYRADLFEEHGIAVPTTWEEYEAAAEQIKAVDHEARIGASTTIDAGSIYTINWQAGSTWFGIDDDAWTVSIDNDITQDVAAMQQRFIDEDLVWTDDNEALNAKQTAGKIWTVLAGSWNGAYLPVNYADQVGLWRVAAPPSFTDEPASAGNGGATFAVTAGSDKQAAAEEFIEWMTTDEAGIQARVAGGASSVLPADPAMVPVAKEAFDASFFGGQDIYKVAEDAAATIPAGWTWGPAQTVMETTFVDNLNAVKTGDTDLASVFGNVQDTVTENLQSRGITVK